MTRDQIQSFIVDSEKIIIKEKIILLLSYKPRSKSEIYQRLLKHNFNSEFTKGVIKDLEDRGYIDDQSFAETYAKYLVKEKQLGKIAVHKKLSFHRIPRDTIELITDKLYDIYKPQIIVNTILKKKKYDKNLEPSIKQKTIQYIMRKGFSWDEISSALYNYEK